MLEIKKKHNKQKAINKNWSRDQRKMEMERDQQRLPSVKLYDEKILEFTWLAKYITIFYQSADSRAQLLTFTCWLCYSLCGLGQILSPSIIRGKQSHTPNTVVLRVKWFNIHRVLEEGLHISSAQLELTSIIKKHCEVEI